MRFMRGQDVRAERGSTGRLFGVPYAKLERGTRATVRECNGVRTRIRTSDGRHETVATHTLRAV